MSRTWWVVLGALGGACLIGGAAVLAATVDPERWNLYALFVGPPLGLVAGGLLGSRVPRMARPARIVSGALVGEGLLSVIGGTAFLFLGGPSEGFARFEGKNFVIGAVVGGVVGLVLGGLAGARTAPDEGSATV